MKVLLNLSEEELTRFSGDVSFYANLLRLQGNRITYTLVNEHGRARRELRKAFERANRKAWPRQLRRALFRTSRWSYIHPSNLSGVDIVLSHILFPYIGRCKISVIWSSQGISPAFYYDATGPFTQSDVVDMYNFFGKRANLLLVWTRSGARNIQNLCSVTTPIAVLPPILDVRPVRESARSLSSKSARCQVLFVGRDPRRKGLYDLLDAYQRLLSIGADLALDVVSYVGPAQERALQAVKGVNYYTGIPDDLVAELMERADVLVLPTYAETYGFVLIEAMARGCALITSDYEPLNEPVVDGENGFVVPPGNVEVLTTKLGLMAQRPDLVKRLAENSLLRYQREFAPERLAPQYIEMFHNLVRESQER